MRTPHPPKSAPEPPPYAPRTAEREFSAEAGPAELDGAHAKPHFGRGFGRKMYLLKHLSRSTLAGKERRCEEAVVRLGRDPRCEIAFDPFVDLFVSERHAELIFKDERVSIVDVGSSNGTFVNGRRILAGIPEPLSGTDVVELGGDQGPSFRVETDEDVRPDTRPVLPRRKAREPEAVSAEAITARGGAAAGTTGATGAATAALRGRGSVGRDTLHGLVVDITKKERRRTAGILVFVLLIVGTGAAVVLLNRPRDTVRETRVESQVETLVDDPYSRLPDRATRLNAALAAARSSVYVVMERRTDAGGEISERPFGTAFSCAPGLLGTNSHVAEEFKERRAGVEFVARSAADPPVDLRLVAYRVHPGYAVYGEFRARFTRGIELERFDALKGGCDVAVLEIHADDVARQAPPLPLASDDDLRAVDVNEPVGYVGFPIEGRGLNRARPAPVVSVGRVTSLSDFFLGVAPFERRQLVAVDAEAGGGASGSPVLGPDGKVLCIVHAVDLKSVQGRRLKTAGGQTYGQRIDLLRELLDGAASRAQETRSTEWRDTFEALYSSAHRDIYQLVQIDATRTLIQRGNLELRPGRGLDDLWEEVGTLDRTLTEGGSAGDQPVEYSPSETGIYLFAAIPTKEPVDIDIPETSKRGLRDTGDDPFPHVADQVLGGKAFKLVLRAAPLKLERPLEVRIKIFRLKP
jgi:hypothetical protein